MTVGEWLMLIAILLCVVLLGYTVTQQWASCHKTSLNLDTGAAEQQDKFPTYIFMLDSPFLDCVVLVEVTYTGQAYLICVCLQEQTSGICSI